MDTAVPRVRSIPAHAGEPSGDGAASLTEAAGVGLSPPTRGSREGSAVAAARACTWVYPRPRGGAMSTPIPLG